MSTEYTYELPPQFALKLQETNECNIVKNTKAVYDSHIYGEWGWNKFIERLNLKNSTSYPKMPSITSNDSSISSFVNLVKSYLRIRAIDGYDEELGVIVNKNNTPISASTAMVAYSAIRWMLDMNGFIANNPLDSGNFKLFFNGWKKQIKYDDDDDIKANPLFYEEMVKITLTNNLPSLTDVGILWFKAVSSLSYLCFFRCDEVLQINIGNVKHCYDVDNLPFYKIEITHRKTKLVEPKMFFIYNYPVEPAINAYFFITKYLSYLHQQNVLHLTSEPFFPFYCRGKLVFGKRNTVSSLTPILKRVFADVGIVEGKISTHTFRRGGARHRLMHSKICWSLDTICEWASWSGTANTLQRYLIHNLNDEMSKKAMTALKYQSEDQSLVALAKAQLVQSHSIQTQLSELRTDLKEQTSRKSVRQSQFQIISNARENNQQNIQIQSNTIGMSTNPSVSAASLVIYEWPLFKCTMDMVNFYVIGIRHRNIPPLIKWPVEKRNRKLRKKFKQIKDVATMHAYYDYKCIPEVWKNKYSKELVSKARDMAAMDIKLISEYLIFI